jgi:hypothetical protein
MASRLIARSIAVLFLCSSLLTTCALAQEMAPFNASQLVKLGDKVRYGVYTIRKIGDGIYQMNNRDSRPPIGGPGEVGVDMYLICGEKKALMIDLGINYVKGTNNIQPRKNASILLMWDTWIGVSFKIWPPARMESSRASGLWRGVGCALWSTRPIPRAAIMALPPDQGRKGVS